MTQHFPTIPVDRSRGVTAAAGFRASGVSAGIKPSGKDDLALVVNDGPEHCGAGVYTTNQVEAAPVTWTRQVVSGGRVDAVLLNAGNANACTGHEGFQSTHRSAEDLAAELCRVGGDVGAGQIAVCSTGVIGERLPIEKLSATVPGLVGALATGAEADSAAARAIMTTDTRPKTAVAAREGYTVAGMAKGSGMIAPSLATMLVVLTTDAVVDGPTCAEVLRAATAVTFDRLDIDGAMSTNDTVLLLASGASGVQPHPDDFASSVLAVCDDLTLQMQEDAEGVTRTATITVTGAESDSAALIAARAVSRDSLVKTALFGADPNWGRVLAAVGASPARIDPWAIRVSFNGHPVCIDGAATSDARDVDLSEAHIVLDIDLGTGGPGTAALRTTDLSHAYVEINSAYTT